MITYNSENGIFHLQTVNTSYVFKVEEDLTLTHTYYGKRLECLDGIADTHDMCKHVDAWVFQAEKGSISTEIIPQEYSFSGSHDVRKAAFRAQYADGSHITRMKFCGYKITPSKPKLCGLPSTYTVKDGEADTLEIEMLDEHTGLTLIYRYSVFGEYDAITRSVTAKNGSENVINIKDIQSVCVDFEDMDFDFIHLQGDWGRERHIERASLLHGRVQIESRWGASSHSHSPFIALARKDTTEACGEVYGFSLVYSGNFEAGAESARFDRTRVYMGINSYDFNWRLEPGESFDTPEAVMVYSDCGLGGMSQIYHKLYAERLARGDWRRKERPVLINNWEATYFDFNEEKILDLAKCAKKVGIELLVLDDGWFGKRNTDNCSLGDWYVNKDKLPGGIDGLADKVNEIGLKFGLWFEPEMISPDSDLYRAHPDWCLHVDGRERTQARQQLILDLSRDDVCDYIISVMDSHLSSGKIAYIKWDMNRNMCEVGSSELPPERQPEVAHRYMLGLYRVLETLKSKYPNVLMEGCAGGGGRFDAGLMHYFDQYWTSDDTDAVERMYIQHGTSLVMPSAFMGAHISAVPNHQVARTTPIATRAAAAMCGQFGYELDITKMSEDELAEISEQIKYYKSIRKIVHRGKMYRLESPFEGKYTSWEYVHGDRAVVFAFIKNAKINVCARRIRLRGLDANSRYRMVSTGEVYSGGVLMNRGICVKQTTDYRADIFEFEKVK